MKNKFVRSTVILACFAFAALFIPSVLIKFEIMYRLILHCTVFSTLVVEFQLILLQGSEFESHKQ